MEQLKVCLACGIRVGNDYITKVLFLYRDKELCVSCRNAWIYLDNKAQTNFSRESTFAELNRGYLRNEKNTYKLTKKELKGRNKSWGKHE